MAGATYVLDKTYTVDSAGGVTKYRAVAPGSADGHCALPSGANQVCLGITQEDQANQNENAAVRKYGISRAYANATIAAGDYVEIASAAGDLQKADLTTVPGAATLHNVVGIAETSATAGEVFFVFLLPSPVVVPVS
jgi:hypothetical protein